MVLRDDFHGKVLLLDIDVGALAHGLHQSALNLSAGIVGVVKDAEFGVAALAVQVEVALAVLVEVHSPAYQFLDLVWCHRHHLFHGLAVADHVAGHHRVLDMFAKIIFQQIGDRSHSTLCKRRIGFVERSLADDAHLTFVRSGHFERVAHPGHSCADDEEIVLINHTNFFCQCKVSASRRQCKAKKGFFFRNLYC